MTDYSFVTCDTHDDGTIAHHPEPAAYQECAEPGLLVELNDGFL